MTCKNLTFEECEVAILRASVDKIDKQQGQELVGLQETKRIIDIVKTFIRQKNCILYGGTAINDVLPRHAQFYDYKYQFPDYDMFSPRALEDTKALADIFVKEGFFDVEAKAGVHQGTYKVFVNQLSVADITFIHQDLYKSLQKRGKIIQGMMYCPINFLKQACYLELSRPMGDVSRWEKVYKRLTLLNKYFPMHHPCKAYTKKCNKQDVHCDPEFRNLIKTSLLKEDVVFIGGLATDIYMKQMAIKRIEPILEFSVISMSAKKTYTNLMDTLQQNGYKPVLKVHKEIGELILEHYSVSVNGQIVAIVFQPVACHSFNVVHIHGHVVKIATIDTLFSYYLTFIFANRDYLDEEKLLCLCNTLFSIQNVHRLTHKGLLQRFNINCYGVQRQLKDIREEKNQMHKKIKPGTKKYDEWFLKYMPKTRKKSRKNSANQITSLSTVN
jgi:hypothetical protein